MTRGNRANTATLGLAAVAVWLALAACTTYPPLMQAAHDDDVEKARDLLLHGADINEREESTRQTALTWAAARGNPKLVALLLQHGADANIRNRRLQTPLMAAAAAGHTEVIGQLLAAGADPQAQTDRGEKAWEFAMRFEHDSATRLLLGKGPVDDTGSRGQTPLFIAACSGRLLLVRDLVDRGAQPNLADSAGRTPLMCATENAHEAAARFLRDHGADPKR